MKLTVMIGEELKRYEIDFDGAAYKELRQKVVSALVKVGATEHLKTPHERSGFIVVPRENGAVLGLYYRLANRVPHSSYVALRDERLAFYRKILQSAGFDVQDIVPLADSADPGLRVEIFD
jgi:hypothetical protein